MRTLEQDPNPAVSSWYTDESARQNHAYTSGIAIRRHCDDAHGGAIDPKCNACVELQKKMHNL